MSNPTELLNCPFCGGTCDPEGWTGTGIAGAIVRGPECEDCGAITDTVEDWNRRAQPEGEAPQADVLYKQYWAQWPPASSDQHAQSRPVAWVYECRQPGDDKDNWAEFFSRNKPSDEPYIRNTRPLYAHVASLSPLCGAQHAESGKERGSIEDYNEFNRLLGNWGQSSWGGCADEIESTKAYGDLVEYIDAWGNMRITTNKEK